MVPDSLVLVRDALARPDRFFRERRVGTSLAAGFVIALVVAVGMTAGLAGVGWLFTGSIDATETVDNPNQPPEWVCDQHADDPNSAFGNACEEEPDEIEIDVGEVVWEEFVGFLPWVFVGSLLVWPVAGAVLFLVGRLAGGDGDFGDTVAMAAWGMLPELFAVAVALVDVYVALRGTTFTGSPESIVADLEATTDGATWRATLGSLFVAAWQAYVWTYGLKHVHGIPIARAGLAAGAVALLWLLIGLA
ncbi:Yip1 family protein [Natronorarus salvus]|uniref:Yip1 family protein n=1 Tax=Natronorarus salvus TaxID=3117733 RepID=UPI002F266A51